MAMSYYCHQFLMNDNSYNVLSEYPTRSIQLTNITMNLSSLLIELEAIGSLRSFRMYMLPCYGAMVVHYYNISNAESALNLIRSGHFYPHSIRAEYVVPSHNDMPPPNNQNQGTIVVFNLDCNISNDALKEIFQRFGLVREIRVTPGTMKHRFVEFYDVRDAERALQEMNGQQIHGKKVMIEFSRAGGRHGKKLFENAIRTTNYYNHQNYYIPHYYPSQNYYIPHYYPSQNYYIPHYYPSQNYYIPHYYPSQNYYIPHYYPSQNYYIPHYYPSQALSYNTKLTEAMEGKIEYMPVMFEPPRDGNQLTEPLSLLDLEDTDDDQPIQIPSDSTSNDVVSTDEQGITQEVSEEKQQVASDCTCDSDSGISNDNDQGKTMEVTDDDDHRVPLQIASDLICGSMRE